MNWWAIGAVDHAMVVAQRHIDHGADGDGVVDHYRALLDRSQTQNRRVGLADDRQAK